MLKVLKDRRHYDESVDRDDKCFKFETNQICYPHEAGMDRERAVWVLLGAGALSAFLSLSSLVTHNSQRIQLQVGDRLVNVTICRYATKYDHSFLQALLSLTLSLVFILVLITTLTYYTYITRALKDLDSPFGERYGTGVDKPFSPPIAQVVSFLSQQYISELLGMSPETSSCISRTTYKVFAVVTVVFVLSYVPHLTVLAMINFVGLDSQVMTSTQRFFLELAYNSPYISTVSNPIIYGFSRQEFRQQCLDLITLKKYRARRSYF
ncbi:hypothetical protein Btru_007919 [Bulinus truncatus]|nr:hypothetical protein Btru_007919 [Bulinus truncatus]